MSELGKAARPAMIHTGDHAPDFDVGVDEDDMFADVAPRTLEAATRLVDPLRLNNLTPWDITPRYLRRARREIRHARRGLQGIQQTSFRLLLKARDEAQRGQTLARMQPSQKRAKQTQTAMRRIIDLREHFAALHDERARLSRKLAAARELESGWEKAGRRTFTGQLAAQKLKQVTLDSAREERVARDWLDELERELQHVNVAEDAMRRDSGALRMDPVTFARFAGKRSRVGVWIGIIAVIIAMVTLFYPPWSPPRLSLGCSFPAQTGGPCNQIHATSDLRIINNGYGALVGWMTITSQRNGANATRIQPVFILPKSSSTLSCGEFGNCTSSEGGPEQVTITSTGGSYTITFVP